MSDDDEETDTDVFENFAAGSSENVTITVGDREWEGTPEEFRRLRDALNEVEFRPTDDKASSIPSDPDERIEWVIERAAMLDEIRDEDWIADTVEYVWNHPDEFERGDALDRPDDVDEADFGLFRLGLLFGTDYEHYFPRDGEWTADTTEDDNARD